MSEKRAVLIRPASPMDAVNIVRLIKGGWKETPAAQISEFDELKLLEYVSTTMKHAFAIVAEHEASGRLLGTVAAAPIRMPWCQGVVLAESWFAVVPHERAKAVPDQLLGELDRFLDKQGLSALLGTQVLTPARFNEVYAKRKGYQPSRATFIRLPTAVPAVAKVGT
jgi:hypothetical protein